MSNAPRFRFWYSLVAAGVFSVLIGLLAIIVPQVARTAVVPLLGVLFALQGLAGLLHLTTGRSGAYFKFLICITVLSNLATSGMLFFHPLDTFITFSVLVALHFGVLGAANAAMGMRMLEMKVDAWLPTLLGGIAAAILTLLIFLRMSGAPAEFIAAAVGIVLIIRGFMVMITGFQSKYIDLAASPADSESVGAAAGTG